MRSEARRAFYFTPLDVSWLFKNDTPSNNAAISEEMFETFSRVAAVIMTSIWRFSSVTHVVIYHYVCIVLCAFVHACARTRAQPSESLWSHDERAAVLMSFPSISHSKGKKTKTERIRNVCLNTAFSEHTEFSTL